VRKKIKPAQNCKGFLVYYSKCDCIYISPANAQIFLKTSKDSNQDIELAGVKRI
jgi:hypothetical protein